LRVKRVVDRLTLGLGRGLLELSLVVRPRVGLRAGGVLGLCRHLRDQLEHLVLHGCGLLLLYLLLLEVLGLGIDGRCLLDLGSAAAIAL